MAWAEMAWTMGLSHNGFRPHGLIRNRLSIHRLNQKWFDQRWLHPKWVGLKRLERQRLSQTWPTPKRLEPHWFEQQCFDEDGGEFVRASLNNNTAKGYEADVERLVGFLRCKGYCVSDSHLFVDPDRRLRMLQKLRVRDRHEIKARQPDNGLDCTFFCIAPNFEQLHNVRMRARMLDLCSIVSGPETDYNLVVAMKTKSPLFRRCYPLNF